MAGTDRGDLFAQQQIHQQELIHIEEQPLQQQMEAPLHQEMAPVQQEAVHAQPIQQEPNGSKHHPNEAQVAVNQQKAKDKALKLARKKDATRQRNDKFRHGFYNCVKPFVSMANAVRRTFGSNERDVMDGTHTISLAEAAPAVQAQRQARKEAVDANREPEPASMLERRYAAEMQDLDSKVREEIPIGNMEQSVWEQRVQQEVQARMEAIQIPLKFRAAQRANVVGGTKPVAIRHTEDGRKWLVKDALSCINMRDPLSPYATKVGADIQKLVHPDTAIEAHVTQMRGRGTVSYQKMLDNVHETVDLFKFSRSPDAMDDQELAQIQRLSPQLLREHTTDWLLCNFDTKGENFITTRQGDGDPVVHGIDKEAAFRRILAPGAQKMSKDYKGFDQDTVYNRLFQAFAAGTMNLDLESVKLQVERVEQMSDEAYMAQFADYLAVRAVEEPDTIEQVRKNILARKSNLRADYRSFFSQLIEERIKNTATTPDEEAAMRLQYFGDAGGGVFIFQGETAEQLQAERQRTADAQANDQVLQQQREKAAAAADEADEISYKRRHALYDFSKAMVMGIKAPAQRFANRKLEDVVHKVSYTRMKNVEEHRTEQHDDQMQLTAGLADIQVTRQLAHEGKIDMEHYYTNQYTAQEQTIIDQAIHERLENTQMDLTMHKWDEVSLGGTKPMSQYYGSDGSRWLTKQAVNCMGYYKEEGALLTEAGAKLQMAMHPETAVEAFVGKTRDHGVVSFQRRLENVEGGPGKLDLFKFSRHPEVATPETIAAVQELAPQILREHATDWLLCNYDTKGENFVITREGDGPRVLHGIDKEAAFNKIMKPEAQAMSTEYKPHANNTLYNVVFTMYAENKMDLNLDDAAAQVLKSEQMSADDYMAMYQPYLKNLEKSDPDNAAQIEARILQRKEDLRQTYETFFTQLVSKRCKTLHPDESAALRARYLVDGRFKFPDQR